jgi:hypothetical protein
MLSPETKLPSTCQFQGKPAAGYKGGEKAHAGGHGAGRVARGAALEQRAPSAVIYGVWPAHSSYVSGCVLACVCVWRHGHVSNLLCGQADDDTAGTAHCQQRLQVEGGREREGGRSSTGRPIGGRAVEP